MFCRLCNSHIHTEENCLTIWRSYIVKKNAEVKYPTIISCYNCGGEGHYGDDCYEPRRIQLRFVEDSAFTGNLLPRKFQNRYYDNLSKQNIIMRQNRTGEQRTPFQDGTKERETENMKKILEKEGQMETTRVMEAVGPGLIMVTIEMVIVGMEMADTIIQEAILSIKGIRDMVIDARHLFILNL